MSGAPPSWLSGAWVRRGIRGQTGPFSEPSLVVWVQAGEMFADIRIAAGPLPGGPPGELSRTRAFSGRVNWTGEEASWHHDLDTMPAARTDRARLRLKGSLLMEAGERYEERWERRPGPEPPFCREIPAGRQRPHARVVAAAGLAVAVWSVPVPGAVLLRSVASGWETAAAIGVPPFDPAPLLAPVPRPTGT